MQRGERFGLIRFGSRMDTFLPLGSKICVSIGERVKGPNHHGNSDEITDHETSICEGETGSGRPCT